ncbi:MAG: apolipoprotein N-acyltransferase [Spirosomataceae bacterium]|jgi:apolipoprotein N-acyltransferase
MTLTKSQKTIRFTLVIVLFLLIFMPAQIPIQALKIGFIVGLGVFSLALQWIISRQTPTGSLHTQSLILMVLTIGICGILLFI